MGVVVDGAFLRGREVHSGAFWSLSAYVREEFLAGYRRNLIFSFGSCLGFVVLHRLSRCHCTKSSLKGLSRPAINEFLFPSVLIIRKYRFSGELHLSESTT